MISKKCSRCGEDKPLDGYYPRNNRPIAYDSECKACAISRTSKYSRKPNAEAARRCNRKLKLLIVNEYGGACKCCGETEPQFLTIDHINGDGAESRRNGEGSGSNLYQKIKKWGFPKDRFQLLCFNCNCAKRQFGTCPHKQVDNTTECMGVCIS